MLAGFQVLLKIQCHYMETVGLIADANISSIAMSVYSLIQVSLSTEEGELEEEEPPEDDILQAKRRVMAVEVETHTTRHTREELRGSHTASPPGSGGVGPLCVAYLRGVDAEMDAVNFFNAVPILSDIRQVTLF